jgi:putative Ca2+/H+ antiporter (TMEM165/GDT1 family)
MLMTYQTNFIVTTTLTKTVSTVQRPIHESPTIGLPCYVCAIGTPRSSDSIKITRAWNPKKNSPHSRSLRLTQAQTTCLNHPNTTPTLTVRLCNTCAPMVIVTPIPGYDPAECRGCKPYEAADFLPHNQGKNKAAPTRRPIVTAAQDRGTKLSAATFVTSTMSEMLDRGALATKSMTADASYAFQYGVGLHYLCIVLMLGLILA